MNGITIDGGKLRQMRYDRELAATYVADVIDSNGQYLLDLEDGRKLRTSTNYLHRLAIVYTPERVAEVITDDQHRQVFVAQVEKQRQARELAAQKNGGRG